MSRRDAEHRRARRIAFASTEALELCAVHKLDPAAAATALDRLRRAREKRTGVWSVESVFLAGAAAAFTASAAQSLGVHDVRLAMFVGLLGGFAWFGVMLTAARKHARLLEDLALDVLARARGETSEPPPTVGP